MANCNFTIDHWHEMITHALELDYHFLFFTDWLNEKPPVKRSIILRHDIDVSLELAVRQARIESELGIKATYFLRLHSKLYTIDNAESLKYLSEIMKSNVEIGIHYETSIYETADEDPAELLARDARRLSSIIGRPIVGCSAHRIGTYPALDITTIKNAGLVFDAFSPEFVVERKYISDSARSWREGCLCQWLGRENHLTVLTHPIWWFKPADCKDSILQRIRRDD